MNAPVRPLLRLALLLTSSPFTATAAVREILVVAGQSNVLNWHASATDLPASPLDAAIPFYHESGGPPARSADAINASSHGRWIPLGPQTQLPFKKYERVFFGPEISLARELSRDARSLGVIKVGYFGTTLAEDWEPSATVGNALCPRMLERVRHAIELRRQAGEQCRIVGFFWMQGESDGAKAAFAARYEENLRRFIRHVRQELDAPRLPFVIGRVGPVPLSGYVHQEAVRTAQQAVARSVPFTAWVDTDDLARDTDGVHLVAAGVQSLGERMAAAWRRLMTAVTSATP